MKEVRVKLYHFDELSDDAKHKVCEIERNRDQNYGVITQESDASERIATLDKFCEVFGIKYCIDYDHSHRFINWKFVDTDSFDIKGKYLWRFLDKFYFDIRTPKYYSGKMWKNPDGTWHHKFRHSQIQFVEQNCPFTGMVYDCDILDKIFDWYKNPDWNISLHDLFENCFDHYLELWDDEDDYRMSDENIGDMITANWEDKLFCEDGTEFEGIYEDVA